MLALIITRVLLDDRDNHGPFFPDCKEKELTWDHYLKEKSLMGAVTVGVPMMPLIHPIWSLVQTVGRRLCHTGFVPAVVFITAGR
jgi:hypothetical protein